MLFKTKLPVGYIDVIHEYNVHAAHIYIYNVASLIYIYIYIHIHIHTYVHILWIDTSGEVRWCIHTWFGVRMW